MVDVSIIIVNWNSRDDVMKCLASIRSDTHDVSIETIVIDSGSFDGCDRLVGAKYPGVRFIQSEKNVGFAAANNLAFTESRGKAVLFLNPDTEVREEAVGVLFRALYEVPGAGAVGGKLLNSDGTIQLSCLQAMPTLLNQLLDSDLLRKWTPKSSLWGMAPLFAASTKPQKADAISGACVMVKREVFESVGGFSEDYFMYAEDIDLAYKVAASGFAAFYVPQAVIVHHGGGSSEQAVSAFSAVMMPEAMRRFLCKTRGKVYGATYRYGMCAAALVRLGMLHLAIGLSFGRQADKLRGAVLKWSAILRWSLHRDDIVQRFYGPGKNASGVARAL